MKFMRVLIITVIIAAIGLFIAWKAVPGVASSSLSKQMQVEVKIDKMHLSPNSLGIENIFVGNPQGYQLPKAFSCGSIHVAAPLLNYIKDPIIIDEITIDQVYFALELTPQQGALSNWSKILSNMPKASSKEKTQEKETKKGTKVLIKKIVLTNITPEMILVTGKSQKMPKIDRLELNNVSSEDGVPIEPIAALILEKIYGKDQIQNLLNGALQDSQSTWEKLTQPFKGVMQK